MLLNPVNEPLKLHQVYILPPASSSSVHSPVPLLLQHPPTDCSELLPSFATAGQVSQRLETLPELLERLDLDSTDSLRKYTKRILHEMVDTCKLGIQGRIREDVQVRLGLLDDQWRDRKLSEAAEIRLGCLASALKNNDVKEADRLHLALIVDHITEVSQWMVAVKRIISELKLQHSSPQLGTPKRFMKSPLPTMSAKSALATDKSRTMNGFKVDSNRVFNDSMPDSVSSGSEVQHKQKHINNSFNGEAISDRGRTRNEVTGDS